MRNYSFNNNKIYVGPIEKIFGSDDGFALFLNGMGFKVPVFFKFDLISILLNTLNLAAIGPVSQHAYKKQTLEVL